MSRTKTIILGAVGPYLATFAVLAGSGDASAQRYRYQHASECHYSNDAAGTGLYNGAYLQNDTGSAKGVYCPVDTDAYMSHAGSGRFARVHYKGSATTGSYSRACQLAETAQSGSCGVAAYWLTGWNAIDPDPLAWNYSLAYAYMYHSMTNGSRLNGFFLHNN